MFFHFILAKILIETINRYLRAAMRVKGDSLPVSESFDKTHSSDAGHQIHLARGDQTAYDRIHRNTVRCETDVIFFEQLRYWIVAGNVEHDGVCAHMFSVHVV